MKRSHRTSHASSRDVGRGVLAAGLLFAQALSGCMTVAPNQRALLADPIMQLDADAGAWGPGRRAAERREGSTAYCAPAGGGCAWP